MPDFIPDPDLNRLVEQLNEEAGKKPTTATSHWNRDQPVEPFLDRDGRLAGLLEEMATRGASDLLLVPGNAPVFRVAGLLTSPAGEKLGEDDLKLMFRRFLSGHLNEKLEMNGSADFSIVLDPSDLPQQGGQITSAAHPWRFRANLHRQRGELAAAVRALPLEIPTLRQLNLPSSLSDLVRTSRGLLLVCGPTGSGKSSTIASLVGEINKSRHLHIVTIEEPIEYSHRSERSLVEQIEIGRDAPSFASALRSALRQDPDVIVLGEMRDLDTVSTALTAAETGHLILSTLHTNDATQAIHRIADVYPATQQGQVFKQLALSLHAIVSQQLIPRADGNGRVPAVEILIANYAIRNQIRRERLQDLYSEISLGKRAGMVTMEDSLAQLVKTRLISPEEARMRAGHPEVLEGLL